MPTNIKSIDVSKGDGALVIRDGPLVILSEAKDLDASVMAEGMNFAKKERSLSSLIASSE
jgi:hypothetical protein